MKKIILLALTLSLAGSPAWAKSVNIAILSDGAKLAQHLNRGQRLQQEIRTLTQHEFDIQFKESQQLNGAWRADNIEQQLTRLLKNKDVDLIITLGPISSHLAATRPRLAKPVIATTIVDVQIQGLPYDKGHSGRHNLNYLSSLHNIEQDITALQRLRPMKHLAILAQGELLKFLPQLQDKGKALADKYGIQITLVPLQDKIGDTIARLPAEVDAVYVTPNPQLAAGQIELLARQLVQRRLPSFSYLGGTEVEAGLLASMATPENLQRFTRRVALNVQRILLGEDAARLPVAFSQASHFTINMATARALDIWPDWELMSEAKLLNERAKDIGRQLSLAQVAEEARRLSLELKANQFALMAAAEEVDLARARLYPQLELGAQALWIDQDRAQASLGSQAERSTRGSLTLNQVLYSDKALANLDIQSHLQKGRIDQHQQLELTVVHSATSAYLNVLRAQNLVQIQKENLRVTRSNLELAKMRQRIGVSGPADLYRWQSEAALNRQELVSAKARMRQSQVILNRLLNQPQETAFASQDVALDDATLLLSRTEVAASIRNQHDFARLRDYLVQDGLARSPELKQYDAAIAAQQRQLLTHQRSYWSPDLVLQAGLTETLSEGGAGSDLTLPFELGANRDDTDWNVAVALKLPLFSGGSRADEVSKSRNTLRQLSLERQSTAARLEEAIRNALHQAGASYANIGLANEAAQAAEKNRLLVTDAYAQGTVAVIQLIDAQRAALVARQRAVDARYQYLLDLMSTQRALGVFGVFLTESERAQWTTHLRSKLKETQ